MNYQEMNREERYFCFLLGHALLASDDFRKKFCKTIGLMPEKLEVYPESAWLRDYWYWKTNQKQKNEREEARSQTLLTILREAFCGDAHLDLAECLSLNKDLKGFVETTKNVAFFRSTKRDKNTLGEITSPGLWGLKAIANTGLSDDNKIKLARLKWAFNAKPDLMLVSSGKAVLIEAKVESGEDKYKFKPHPHVPQTEIQDNEISRLMVGLSQKTSQQISNIKCLFLTNCGRGHLDWTRDVVSLLKDSSVDDFTLRGLSEARVFTDKAAKMGR